MLIDLGTHSDMTARNGAYGVECTLYWDVPTTKMYVNAISNFTLGNEDRFISHSFDSLNEEPDQPS